MSKYDHLLYTNGRCDKCGERVGASWQAKARHHATVRRLWLKQRRDELAAWRGAS